MNIIIADDHQMVIDGIKSMLQTETNYTVVEEALNGQLAFDQITLNPEKYQILLTDISMPVLGGIDLCKKVKADFPHIQVLMLSMYSDGPAVKQAVMAEADGYILKSSGKEELLSALHRISNGGTYFSQDILPIIYSQYIHQKTQDGAIKNVSPREKEILNLIVKELTSQEIADKLFISKKTVDKHRQNLFVKCNCKTTIGLVKFAIKNSLA